LGPVTFGKKSEQIFIGREIAQHRDYSESTAMLIDEEVKRIVQAASKRSEQILKKNEKTLHRLAEALLEREILDGEEVDRIIKGKPLKKKTNSVKAKSKSNKVTAKTHKRNII